MSEDIKARLRAKIVTEQDLVTALGSRSMFTSLRDNCASEKNMAASQVLWWAVREHARFHYEVYEKTDALDKLNSHSNAFAHHSVEEPTLVAYTPDRAAGEADRQIRLSLGRLLLKAIPFATDNYVADLVSDHFAELSHDIDYIDGADIVQAYVSGMSSGASSCMSGKVNNFVVQPTVAYAVQDKSIRMAVLYEPGQSSLPPHKRKIKARAMVCYVGDEKRWIRNYGDPKLVKKLERLGYVKGAWQGVKFNKVVAPNYSDAYCMPYLDANGGTCSSVGSTVALIDGELRGLTEDQYSSFSAAGLSMSLPGTSGRVSLRNIDTSEFAQVDGLNGETFSILKERVVFVFDGVKAIKTRESTIRALNENQQDNAEQFRVLRLLPAQPGYSSEMVRAVTYARAALTFQYDGWNLLDCPETRRHYKFYKLSEKYYPEDRSWHRYGKCTVIDPVDGSEHTVKEEDTLPYVVNSQLVRVFGKEPAKTDIKLHAERGKVAYVRAGDVFYKTPTGRKVHPAWNGSVIKTWKGYDFSRNAPRSDSVLGQSYHYAAADRGTPEMVEWLQTMMTKRMDEIREDSTLGEWVRGVFANMNYHRYIMNSEGNKHFTSSVRMYDISRLKSVAYYKELMADFRKAYQGTTETAVASYFDIWVAEMEALDVDDQRTVPDSSSVDPIEEKASALPVVSVSTPNVTIVNAAGTGSAGFSAVTWLDSNVTSVA